jgi:deoxyguanosine kinase
MRSGRAVVAKAQARVRVAPASDCRRRGFHTAFEGPVGAGKTTYARALAEATGAELVLEEFDANPFLMDFYQDPGEYALQAQFTFAMLHFTQMRRVRRLTAAGKDVVSDFTFDKVWLYSSLVLTDSEMALLTPVLEHLRARMTLPDLTVFLDASVDSLLGRIASRGRSFESEMPRAYLARMRSVLHGFYVDRAAGPVEVVDSSATDIIRDPAALDEVVRRVAERRSDGR